jgi:hypothetical protein
MSIPAPVRLVVFGDGIFYAVMIYLPLLAARSPSIAMPGRSNEDPLGSGRWLAIPLLAGTRRGGGAPESPTAPFLESCPQAKHRGHLSAVSTNGTDLRL